MQGCSGTGCRGTRRRGAELQKWGAQGLRTAGGAVGAEVGGRTTFASAPLTHPASGGPRAEQEEQQPVVFIPTDANLILLY